MKTSILSTLALATTAFAGPIMHRRDVAPHESGGYEHIVIVDKSSPIPPRVAEILSRLALNESHADVHHVFNNSAFAGFAASMKSHCLDQLANMTDVSLVEATTNVQSTLHSHSLHRRDTAVNMVTTSAFTTRPNSPWGLQRISTNAATLSGDPEIMDFSYNYANPALGSQADIYIVDTGLYTQHADFGTRASMLWAFDNQLNDTDGHGTHVAGTAAGHLLGVASNANVFGIRALDSEGGGWSSNVVAGIDRVMQEHDKRTSAANNPSAGSVMSLSLAASAPVAAIDAAIAAAVAAGVHTCVAAGNAGEDACGSSPSASGGSGGGAITVGSVGMDDVRSDFSNYGDCVDVYAPGEDIISAWPGDPKFVNSLSGTSMATPHVTGIVAYAVAANATLAKDPGRMKEWVRMNGLQLGGDKAGDKGSQEVGSMVLANNGVHALSGVGAAGSAGVQAASQEGMVGFSTKSRVQTTAGGFVKAEGAERPVRLQQMRPVALERLLAGEVAEVQKRAEAVVSWPDSVVKLIETAAGEEEEEQVEKRAEAVVSWPDSVIHLVENAAEEEDVEKRAEAVVSWPDSVIKLVEDAAGAKGAGVDKRAEAVVSWPNSVIHLLETGADSPSSSSAETGTEKRWTATPDAKGFVMDQGFIARDASTTRSALPKRAEAVVSWPASVLHLLDSATTTSSSSSSSPDAESAKEKRWTPTPDAKDFVMDQEFIARERSESGTRHGRRQNVGHGMRHGRRWVLSDDGTEVKAGGGYVMSEGFIAREKRHGRV